MNALYSVMYLHAKNRYIWLLVPWIIVMSSFVMSFLISLLLRENGAIYSGGVASIYIFAFVQGIVTLNDTFAFVLGLSARRKDYFLGTVLLMLLCAAITALCLTFLALIERYVLVDWGIGLRFFALPYLNDGPVATQFWISFVLLAHMSLLGLAIGSIYRRFGKTGMWVFFILAFVSVSSWVFLSTYLRWWGDFAAWFTRVPVVELTLWLVLLIFIYALTAFFLLRKATV